MGSIGTDDVGSALLMMLAFMAVSIAIVALVMWWVFRVFRHKKTQDLPPIDQEAPSSETEQKS